MRQAERVRGRDRQARVAKVVGSGESAVAAIQDMVYRQVAQLEAVCRAFVLTRAKPNGVTPGPDPDQVVRLADAASRLSMSKDFLHRSWRKLGGFKDDDGHVKFSLRIITRHVRSREQR